MFARPVFLGGMVTYILAAQHGLGRHTDTIEKEDHQKYLKLTFIQAILSSIGVWRSSNCP